MPFQLSPGVAVVEKDFSSIVPAVATSTGAFAGTFQWGPVLDPVTVNSENVLVQRFGRPTDDNATSFFTAANFLAYTNNLLVVRADTMNHKNAVVNLSGGLSGFTKVDGGSLYSSAPTVEISAPDIEGGIQATAHAVLDGNTVDELVIDIAGTGYTSAPTVTFTSGSGSGADFTASISIGGVKINNSNVYQSTFADGSGVVGQWAAKYPGTLGNSLLISMADSNTFSGWDYENEFDSAPGTSSYAAGVSGENDEMHVIVVDADGRWTGIPGSILEKFAYVSKASDAKKSDGTNNYYPDVINSRSAFIWWMDHPTGVTGTTEFGSPAANASFKDLDDAITATLVGGVDDMTATDGQLMTAWEIFADDSQYDISLLPLGKASTTVVDYVIGNVAENRLDCVVFASPQDVDSGDVIIGNGSTATDAINAYRNELPSSSYAVMDSGYKYQYDRYNDKYRWIPLNGDIAGLCARTDYSNDPWYSPGGLNRGQIKNVVKLSTNPTKTDRDNLYKNGVNPVVSFPGQGVVLFGDKTLLSKPSAFDRINVRRLFIVLEKSIATASKYQLFEFNDSFTRAQFKNLVEPFLRDVQGRRGITEFVVECDDTNNTGEVIDRNEFVADIFIKPNRSINFITLNFVAARSSINFSEIGA